MTNNQTNQVLKKEINSSLIMIGLSLATLMSSIDSTIVTIGLPIIAKSLNTGFANIQWIVLSYLLSVTTLVIGVGRMGDMFGKKKLYLCGISIFTIASFLCGLSLTIHTLIVARILQGIGGAIMMALSFAMVGDVVPKNKIAQAMGILTSIFTLGIALGPSLGGVLIGLFGWHSIFLVNIPIGIVTFLIASKFPESPITNKEQRFDWLGILVIGASVVCYDLGITFSENQGASAMVFILLLTALVGTGIFINIERRVSSPLINLHIFHDRVISGSLGISVILYAMIMSIGMLLPFFLANAQGLPTFEVGLLAAVGHFATTLMGPLAGKTAERFGNRSVMIAGMVGFGIGCLLMTTLTPSSSALGFAARIAISNGSFAFFQTPNNAAIMVAARPEQRGVISGLLNLARTLGQTTGASLMGAVFAHFTIISEKAIHMDGAQASINSASAAAITSGIHTTFFIAATAVVLAIFIGLIVLKQHKQPRMEP